MNQQEPEKKFCVHCSSNIRRRLNSYPWKTGVCSKCLNTRPEYADLKRQRSALRQQKFYENNAEKERKRQAAIYQKKVKEKANSN
ncbi:MAG: hypothetical protein AB4372_01580 [Xenococcus sp. (in: cyanobacteria)]